MVERNVGVSPEKRIEFRVGIHLGDVVEESDGDLMGDGVNIASRLEAIAEPNGVCVSSAAYEQVRDKLQHQFVDLGLKELKNIARPVRVYAVNTGWGSAVPAPSAVPNRQGPPRLRLSSCRSKILAASPSRNTSSTASRRHHTGLSRTRWLFVIARNSSFSYKGRAVDVSQVGRELDVRYVLEGSVRKAALDCA